MTNHDDPATPPSFAPSPRRRGHTLGSAGSTGSAASGAAGGRPSAASGHDATPPSFAPHSGHAHAQEATPARAPRSSGSSSSHVSAPSIAPRGTQARPASQAPGAPRTQTRKAPAASAASRPARGGATAARTRTRSPHRVRNIILGILLAIVLVLGGTVIGVWNWVDHGLRKEDWIPSGTKSNNATSWLLLGSDERDGTTGSDDTPGDRTDTILVLTKPRTGPSSLISIPRDSLVQVDDAYLKINAVMQNYGREELVRQVEDITGQPIDHVVLITFGGLTKVVDALGGVTLCYDADVNDEKSGLVWKSGCHVADGQTALAFSRMRYSDPKGDFGRAERQQQVIAAIAKKAASASTLLNPGKIRKVGDAALAAIQVDKKTNPKTLLDMFLAFRSASSDKGITGSLYWTDPGYYVDGVGSSVLLDNDKNLKLFSELNDGTHAAGKVGSAAELQ
ncbi:MAG: LCP family protein [Bifidobacterium sp.]|nr:LCP family protein [Bifidobacterium sp.]